jgi:hypothetical protein
MPILAIFNASNIKKTEYETLRKEVDWEHQKPNGMLIHTAAFDDRGGVHVADVWESRAALDDFFNKRLVPAMKKHNISPPTGEFYQLHNANIHSGADKFRIAA